MLSFAKLSPEIIAGSALIYLLLYPCSAAAWGTRYLRALQQEGSARELSFPGAKDVQATQKEGVFCSQRSSVEPALKLCSQRSSVILGMKGCYALFKAFFPLTAGHSDQSKGLIGTSAKLTRWVKLVLDVKSFYFSGWEVVGIWHQSDFLVELFTKVSQSQVAEKKWWKLKRQRESMEYKYLCFQSATE